MASIKSVRSWNVIWDKLQSFLGFSGVDSPFSSGPAVIDEPLTLYVETWGNDNNPGTQDRPYKTVQAAVDYVSQFEMSDSVTIQVGVGTFEGFAVQNLKFRPRRPSGTTTFTIRGTTRDVGSGSCTSATAATGELVITDLSKNWTVNEHKGKFFDLTWSGGTLKSICTANTATTASFVIGSSLSITAYSIREFQTEISTKTIESAGNTVVFYGPYEGQGSSSAVTISEVRLAGSALVRGGARATFSACDFSGGAAGTNGPVLFGGGMTLTNCRMNGKRAFALASSVVLGQLSFGGCFISNLSGIALDVSGCDVRISGPNVFDACATAIQVVGSQMQSVLFTTARIHFQNCTTGVSLLRARIVEINASYSVAFHGSGNGTVFSINKGSTCQIGSASTVTGTTEINVDGVTSTLAAMRANSPKIFPLTPNPYGSYVYE